jgi:opacity protein-like surface antigen
MMRSIWKSATIGVFAILFGNPANAADVGQLPGAPSLLESVPLLVDEFGSNWYLRGDIGYRFHNDFDRARNLDPPPQARNSDLDNNAWVFGAGVGYKMDWFRVDVTLDVSTTANFEADSRVRERDFKAKIDTVSGLVNAYGDLGTWWGFTPYVGAGVGFARLKASGFRIPSEHAGDSRSDESWNFAWAYMAGVSYRISPNFLVDAGYRHINMGDVWSGVDRERNRLAVKNFSSDEVRVGFRYVLD